MSINSKLIIENIIDAYKKSVYTKIEGDSNGEVHRKRSKKFIDNMTENLKNIYNKEDIIIFSSKERNETFRRNELLYDINVCKINKLSNNQSIEYVEKSLLQIESEFERNTRSVAIDFSKLVCGNSELKIMITSKVHKDKDFRESLEPIAANIKEELYLIQLEHPENWDVCDEYSVYKFDNNWIEV